MTEVDRAWVAGLLEGEGYFTIITSTRSIRVGCGMTDLEVLERLRVKTNFGNICGPTRVGVSNRKPLWHWQVCVRQQVLDLVMDIYPLMSKRRRDRIDELIMYHRLQKGV